VLFTYFTVTKATLSVFNCIPVSGVYDAETGDVHRVLEGTPSVPCTGEAYNALWTNAVVVLVLVVVAVPVGLALSLFQHRAMIKEIIIYQTEQVALQREQMMSGFDSSIGDGSSVVDDGGPGRDEDLSSVSIRRNDGTGDGPTIASAMFARRYGLLFDTYAPHAWWWEPLSLFERLLVTVVLLVKPVSTDSNEDGLMVRLVVQYTFAVLLLVHHQLKPLFRTGPAQRADIVARHFVVFCSIASVGGMFVDNPTLGGDDSLRIQTAIQILILLAVIASVFLLNYASGWVIGSNKRSTQY
jgi:hypothetical protein